MKVYGPTPHLLVRGRNAQSARSKEVGVATEMLLTKAEQVSDVRACAGVLRPAAVALAGAKA
jgi:hypothetical protein